ncbi:glycoside hydrolase family 48 protein [Aquimarina algicola]|nr:glycoside hydrolase family 48 protein [Aquimarina algicola]
MRNFIKSGAMLLLLLACGTITAQFNYGEALQKSLLFYETQQSGVLPDWNRISWRSNAGVNDGKDVGLDLTGGWHDAGDHVKFGFPMAFSVTALNWGYLEYKDGYDSANQTEHFKQNIKWVTDYFIKCHPSPNEFYAQVADSKSQDHNFWMSPEMVDVHPQYGQRKSYKLSPTAPGTEVACETAAALASASIIFKDSDPAYSATLLRHAKELYAFGDTYRGLYNEDGNIPATGTYSSGGFQDELTWGALWLYKATGEQKYLDKAEAEYSQPDFLWSLVWDDKSYGNMVLLSIITGKDNYKADAERHLDFWQRGGGINYSPGGQAHLTQWGSLRHAMNASLTALIYSDNVATPKKQQYHDFAVAQVNYALGDNPNNRSLVTGFGVNPPTKPHHRGQHASWARSTSVPEESRHTLWGALMGGPGMPNDAFEEDRNDFQANEVATDYNACYQGVLARMVMEFGGSELKDFPQPETPGLEFINEVRLNNDQSRFTEVAIWLNNRSAWPARVPGTLKARYFIDISEGVAAGFSVSDYSIIARGAGTAVSGLQAWDASQNIYYAEVEVDQDQMPFPGGQGEYRSEIQLRIALPNDAPESAWDATNDFSYTGLNNSLKIVDNVPIYVDGVLAGGKEPNGGDTPTASFTASPETGIAPLEVSFNASASSDPNGDALTYSWDFNNGQTSTAVSPKITFTQVGTYEVTLTVSDGSNTSSPATKTITVTDGSPIASFTASATSGVAPFQVTFDAAGSSDPAGGNLTYSWDLGNGDTANTATASTTYTQVGVFTVTLTVENAAGQTNTTTETITITDGSSPSCAFDTPLATALPNINSQFENIYVLGNGGPNLDNVTNFTINWDLENNGLYQFSMNTNNGVPSWWNDLLPKVTQNFNATQPEVTITGSGFAGLDGTYWATVDNNNFVLVSKTADFTLYFSTSATAPDCGSSTTNPSVVSGGAITGGPFTFTVGDNLKDNVSGVTLAGNTGAKSQWVVTDDQNTILGLPASPEVVDFDGAGTGTCYIWHLSYEEGLQGLEVNNKVTDLSGDFDFSNSIAIVRNPVVVNNPPSALLDCTFGTPLATTLPSINTQFENIYVLGNGGPNLDNVTNFTINWDLANNGLYQFSMNTNNGVPSWWNDLLPKVTQNFNAAQPEITITGSGFTGLDGTYWATIDSNNFVLVSKTEGFTLYFSTSSIAPDCGAGNGNTNPVANIAATPTSGEAPLLVSFDASGSTDADGDTLSYNWDFGDGTSATGVTVQNTYSSVADYEVTLTVTDGNGGEDQAKITIKVNDGDIIINPPTGDNEYIDRFIEMRNEFYDPANGYFSADGSPHHSIETLIVEAPDHGHESTSELYSYWLWLEVMNGRITKDWAPLNNVWNKIEEFIIPTNADQPSNAAYNPSSPAAYASEFPLPSDYPAPLNFGAPVGSDPVSPDLTAAYGPDIYQMHWLLDNDNFYGYGNRGDGVSTPSYINTFQRGEQESVFETVPHPSWESFDWGGQNGYLPLFVEDQNYAKQWRYTSAPDADARAVQAMYWAQIYAKEQGASLSNLDLDKAVKMGDFLRLSMFDKYFKPLGVQSATSGAGTGYDSAHYLMSWYMSWGGSADPASQWAFRISSSHCHFGYQNPVAAYALTQVDELKPKSQNGERDWTESLKRQMEFYTWLQSKEGAIAGGATNSWNGDYSPYPSGKSTFYDMAYDKDPVYHDPGSGTWFGWQAWSMERVAEYYYITNDAMAKNLMDKWAAWVKSQVVLIGNNDFDIPATLEWSGEPDTWNPNNPGSNNNLSVTVTDYNKDLGVAASMAKALIYYAAATQKYGTLDTEAKDLAKEVLDRMWVTYRDDKGVSSPEERGDFKRIFEQEVYIPQGFSGTMPNGDQIKPGVSFLDIRSDLKNDPEFDRLQQAYDSGTDFTQNYHRSWAQIEVALANAEFGFFFGDANSAGTAAVQRQFDAVVSPNPAKNYVNVMSKNMVGNVQMRLISLSGNVVATKLLKDKQVQTRLSLQGVPAGIYVLEMVDLTTREVSRSKIVVK